MRKRREASRRMHVLRLWTRSEAFKAVPYLRSVLGSLREHWLEAINLQCRLERLRTPETGAKTQALIEQSNLREECSRAQRRFDDALEELNQRDVFLLDPVRGTALIPFRKGDDLAWFVFDYFAPKGLIGWRNHADSIETCRSLKLLPDSSADGARQGCERPTTPSD